MEFTKLFETVLDNLTDGIYVLDDRGNYIFVNSAYVQKLSRPKSQWLHTNVHDLLRDGEIDVCISDIVYREKRRVVMFQDVHDPHGFGRKSIRQMVISTPVFNEEGNVQNIVAVVRPMDDLNELYHEASLSDVVSMARPSIPQSARDDSIIAESPAMQNILEMARLVAGVDSAVLISGESGTGKEVIAQYLHSSSGRAQKPLIVINCASLPENLLEAELFGYEKGAFTGAAPGGKRGLFEEAEGGTLFLDEVNSLPINLQGKLLRAIETKRIQRIGSNKTISVDFRLVSATNEDLEKLIEEKRFRSDLYYRLNVIPITLPPLRERREDICPLANYFLYHFCQKYSKSKLFSHKTLHNIAQYDWPGNVRQLKNFVERAVVMSIDEVIEIDNVAGITGPPPHRPIAWDISDPPAHTTSDDSYLQLLAEGVSLEAYVSRCEKEYLQAVLKKYPNSYRAAEVLGTSQASIIRRKKKYHL